MRTIKWLRFGLASVVLTGASVSALLVACGDDDTGGTTPGNDSGTPDTGTPTSDSGGGNDSGGGDSAATDSGTDAGPPAKLTLVNAARSLGEHDPIDAVRVCFRAADKGADAAALDPTPFPALPDTPPGASPTSPPGIYPGTGGVFPQFPGVDLATKIIQPVVMNAYSIRTVVKGSSELACDELLNPDAGTPLVENQDYWVLPVIDAGKFPRDKSFLLALTGCAADAPVALGDTECGAGRTFDANGGVGNLKLQILELQRAPIDAAKLGVQFAQLSPSADAILAAAGGVVPGFMGDLADAGSFKAATSGAVTFPTLTAAQGVDGVADTDYFVANKGGVATGGPLAAYSLPQVAALSFGDASVPYKAGANFVFIATGDADPSQPTYVDPQTGQPSDAGTAIFNTRKFHFLAFPTDPVVPDFK